MAENVLLCTAAANRQQPPQTLLVSQKSLSQGVIQPPELGSMTDKAWLIASGFNKPTNKVLNDAIGVIVVNPKTCEEVPHGEIGEIWITGQVCMHNNVF